MKKPEWYRSNKKRKKSTWHKQIISRSLQYILNLNYWRHKLLQIKRCVHVSVEFNSWSKIDYSRKTQKWYHRGYCYRQFLAVCGEEKWPFRRSLKHTDMFIKENLRNNTCHFAAWLQSLFLATFINHDKTSCIHNKAVKILPTLLQSINGGQIRAIQSKTQFTKTAKWMSNYDLNSLWNIPLFIHILFWNLAGNKASDFPPLASITLKQTQIVTKPSSSYEIKRTPFWRGNSKKKKEQMLSKF